MCCSLSARPGTPFELICASQGNEEAEKPGSVTLKYDIEPLPSDMTAEQRFFEGENQIQCTCQDMLLSTLYVSCFLYMNSTSVTPKSMRYCCRVYPAGMPVMLLSALHGCCIFQTIC